MQPWCVAACPRCFATRAWHPVMNLSARCRARMWCGLSHLFFGDQVFDVADGVFDSYLCWVGVCAEFDFSVTLFQAFASDDNSNRDADQVGVFEFETGAMISIVHQHVDTGRHQFIINVICCGHDIFVFDVQRDQFHGVRCDGKRPDNAVVVVTGFDDGRDNSSDSDAVAAHDDGVTFFFFVQITGVE